MNREEIRNLSSLLFGNADRLEAAAAIGRLLGKPISATAISKESGLDYSRAQEQVARLRRAGVLIPEFDPDSRRKDYRAANLPFWACADQLLSKLAELDSID